MSSNYSSGPRGLCYPTAEPDEAVFTHESWEKEKTLSFKAFQEKAFDLSPCLWGRKGGSPRPSMHTRPVQCSHVRRAQAPCLLCLLIPEHLHVLECTPGVHLPNHLDLDFLPESLCQLGSNVHHVHQSREVELGGSLSLLGGSEELLQVFESVRKRRALLQLWNLVSLLTPSLLSS